MIKKIYSNKFTASYIVSAVLVVVLAFVPGIYYETGSDIYIKILSAGTFTGKPEPILNNFGTYIFINYIFVWLYTLVNSFPWFDAFVLICLVLIAGNLTFLLYYLRVQFKRNVWIDLLLFSVYLMGIETFLLVETARTSAMLTGLSIITLTLLHLREDLSQQQKIWFLCIAVLGMLVRIESSVLIMFLLILIIIPAIQQRVSLLRLLLPLFVVVIFLSVILNIPFTVEDKNYLAIRPHQFALWDFCKEQSDVSLFTKADSVTYATAKDFFLADESKMSPEYFDSIGVVRADKTPANLINLLKHGKLSKFYRLVPLYLEYLGTFILVWFAIGMHFFLTGQRKFATSWVAFVACMAIICLAVFMKMEFRIFQPILFISSLCWLLINYQFMTGTRMKDAAKVLVVIVLLLSFIGAFFRLSDHYCEKKANEDLLGQLKGQLKALPFQSFVLVDLVAFINWSSRIGIVEKFKSTPTLVSLDNGIFFLQQGQKNFLDSKFECHDFDCVVRFLELVPDNNLYALGTKDRLNLLKEYLAEVYQIETIFREVKPEPIAPSGIHYKLYHLDFRQTDRRTNP